MTVLLTCRDVAEMLTDFMEGVLPLQARLRTRIHLLGCPACRALLATVQALPRIVNQALEGVHIPAPPEAQAALRNALSLIGTYRPPKGICPSPIPEPLAEILERKPDLPLKVMAETREAMIAGRMKDHPPYLPECILAQLPPPGLWTWKKHGRTRAAVLWEDKVQGLRLSLVEILAGFHAPLHTHFGSESVLVLDGAMEDGLDMYSTGQWIHFPQDSSHAPAVLGDRCWCLVRDEGTITYHGPMGWYRRITAA